MVDQGIIRHQPKITDQNIAMGLFAALSHDICHDGTRNTIDGVHIPFRLEQNSIDNAMIWADVSDPCQKAFITTALSLVYGTDLSGRPSPARIIRLWHDSQFKEGSPPTAVSYDRSKLEPIIIHRDNTLVAAMVQDADVFTSVIDETYFNKESQRFADEAGRARSPGSELFFLHSLENGRMTTDVARSFADDFMARKIAQYLHAASVL